MTENDLAWELVFEQLQLRQTLQIEGFCFLTAKQLKDHGLREPRLMAKLDTLSERPRIFQENDVAIFPVQNGRYILFNDRDQKSYFRFGNSLENITPETYLSALDLNRFDSYPKDKQFSECQAIDFAFISSLLRTFCGDPEIHLTVRGRLFSDDFTFRLPQNNYLVNVSRVQIEVDAGYEGRDSIFLIEAKVGRRSDFHIRQLYYPFLNWSQKSRKRIVPIFLTFTNGQYYLTEFGFSQNFGELSTIRNRCYTINDSPLAEIQWHQLLEQTPRENEGTPFPQADDMDKVVDLVKLVEAGINDKFQIADSFEIDERQGDYYANAAKYLGFLQKDDRRFELTALGSAFCRIQARSGRTVQLVKQLLKRPTFREIMELVSRRDWKLAALDNRELAGIIAHHTGLNTTTAERRVSTARSWLNWILRNSRLVK